MPLTIKGKPGKRYFFNCACDGLVESIRKAADPSKKDWYPYYGNVVDVAVWNARDVYRQARKLGLYPSVTQLEAECRQVA